METFYTALACLGFVLVMVAMVISVGHGPVKSIVAPLAMVSGLMVAVAFSSRGEAVAIAAAGVAVVLARVACGRVSAFRLSAGE